MTIQIPFRSSFQSFCVFVNNRDAVIQAMKKENIETQIGTYSLHMHKAFADNPVCRIMGTLENSRYAFEHCLTLPLYNDLTEEDQKFIIQSC
jgi:perosamine synthetase